MGAGVAGGMAAAGIMALVISLEMQSVTQRSLLGSLLLGRRSGSHRCDPAPVPSDPHYRIIRLYEGIMHFYKFWNGIWSSKAMQLIGSCLATVGGILAKAYPHFFNVRFGLLGAAGSIIWNFLQWLWGIATAARGIEYSLLFNIPGAIWNFLQWLWNVTSGIRGAEFSLLMSIGGAALLLTMALEYDHERRGESTSSILRQGPATRLLVHSLVPVVAVRIESGIWESPDSIWWRSVRPTTRGCPWRRDRNQSSGQSTGNITINANNYVGSKTELMKVVTDALRQNQYRYNV